MTYSNDNPGETEVLRVEVDGVSIGTVRAQNTGDDGEGWNVFVADRAGTSMLRPGIHTVIVESTGGDECIEIDLITVRPCPVARARQRCLYTLALRTVVIDAGLACRRG